MLRDHLLSSYTNGDSSPFANLSPVGILPDLEAQDHEYPDLYQINTEDLMPLSAEQSQHLSPLISQQCDVNQVLPQFHEVLPDLSEHDNAGLNFELNLASQPKGKVNWFYSKDSNKVYIKLNEKFNIEAVYSPRSNIDMHNKFFIRAMMVFNTEVSEPVVRCENHSSKDTAVEKNIKHSVLRCENPNVIYLGSVDGKNVSDRLSVRIPLGGVAPNEDNVVKQTVALKFVCQNSCVGRKDTSIIFYLENANGEVLAKRTTAVKICSCPKRDMNKDQSSESSKKRSRKDNCPVGKKVMKLETDIKVEIPQENDEEDETNSGASDTNDVVITPSGSVRLMLDLPDIEAACHVMKCAFNQVAGQIALNPDNAALQSSFRTLKKNLVKLQSRRGQK